nr:hypothetical protein Q903MT_gene5142 [Picea sitchensis]
MKDEIYCLYLSMHPLYRAPLVCYVVLVRAKVCWAGMAPQKPFGVRATGKVERS